LDGGEIVIGVEHGDVKTAAHDDIGAVDQPAGMWIVAGAAMM
jgi:hypothetical protein